MKAFLDTNVVVDFSAEREPFYKDAAAIVDMAYHKETASIIHYIESLRQTLT